MHPPLSEFRKRSCHDPVILRGWRRRRKQVSSTPGTHGRRRQSTHGSNRSLGFWLRSVEWYIRQGYFGKLGWLCRVFSRRCGLNSGFRCTAWRIRYGGGCKCFRSCTMIGCDRSRWRRQSFRRTDLGTGVCRFNRWYDIRFGRAGECGGSCLGRRACHEPYRRCRKSRGTASLCKIGNRRGWKRSVTGWLV